MDSSVFSESVKMRLVIWLSLLSKACDYLVVCEKYYKKLLESEETITGGSYYINDNKRTYSDYWTIEKGLSEAAVIAIENVLSQSGYGNDNIAGNLADEIKTAREELLKRASIKLEFSDYEDFEKYRSSIENLRSKIIAHYDATAAEYREVPEVIAQLKMPSAVFSLEEITKLKEYVIALLSSLKDILSEYLP